MDNAGDFAAELGLDGDDEAFAADGDDFVLRRTGLVEGADGAAEARFDGAVLRFHGAADAAEFGAGVVRERAVGVDFAAERAEERGEVVGEEVGGEGVERYAEVGGAHAVAGGEQVAPGGDAFDDFEQGEDLEGFEGGAGDAGFVEEGCGVEEAVEVEGPASLEEGAHLERALLLRGDPFDVGGGLEREGDSAAERADRLGGDELAQARPFKSGGTGFKERLSHASIVEPMASTTATAS